MKKITKEKSLKGKEIINEAIHALEVHSLPTETKVIFQSLIDYSLVLTHQLGLNSANSSIPPSKDPHRVRRSSANGSKRKPGGQMGHIGKFLLQSENPTITEEIFVKLSTLPPGTYEPVGFEKRQVFDIEFSLTITEYRAEIVKNAMGEEFMANFPEGVTEAVQYGNSVKSTSTYLSQSQLIPLGRVKDCFTDQFGLSLSKGSISNFNELGYNLLEPFEDWAKSELLASITNNADETSININGKKHWLHCLSNKRVVLFHPDEKRGVDAIERMGVILWYTGNLIHDHWKPYFVYDNSIHSLCNGHHLRELERAFEQDGQKWARRMQLLLLKIKNETEKHGGVLPKKKADKFKKRYRLILKNAEIECPLEQKTRAQSKSRNLLMRLKNFEVETLRFMEDINVPFTNNRAENDQRMTKVQQKISGCIRSLEGAKIFCRIRSYLLTCQKNGVSPTEALRLLFDKKLPAFMT